MGVGEIACKALIYGGMFTLLVSLVIMLVLNKKDGRSPWRKLHDGRP